MTYCTIITGGYGAPHRFYGTADAALRAAVRRHKRAGDGVEIAWCRDGNPKVWVAYVTAGGVRKTEHWEWASDGGSVALDGRHRIAREFTGAARPQWVFRCCGDFVSAHANKAEAIAEALKWEALRPYR